MNFYIAHKGYSHIRIKSRFPITLDVQDYLRNLILKFKNIKKIVFYIDEKHFTLIFNEECDTLKETKLFLDEIKKEDIENLIKLPIRKIDTPYSIVSDAIFKRIIYKNLVPFPIRYIRTIYFAYKYLKNSIKYIKNKELNMEVLDTTAILISLCTNQSKTASNIMFMLDLGNSLDSWSLKKSISDLENNLQNKDYNVWLINEDKKTQIKSSEVKVGDILLISEGNEIFFDGIIRKGSASINESTLTGETFPVEKSVGDNLFSNTTLENGEIYLEVTNNQLNSRIKQLVSLMKEAENLKNTQSKKFIELADRVVKYNFFGAILTYLLTKSFVKSISFLLVDFSCALKISTPVAYLTAVKEALDKKIVVKSSEVFDSYNVIDAMFFDKTGTITTSHPIVKDIITFYEYSKEEVIRVSACLEEHIHHPIASAIVNKADEDGIVHEEMHDKLNYIASRGIKSLIDGHKVVIGNYFLMKEEDIEITSEQLAIIENNKLKYNLLFLGYKNKLIAIFCIDTPLRNEAKKVLKKLRENGKEINLLTGDTEERTNNVIKDIKFDNVYTNLSPQDKYDIIKKLREDNKNVLMIGDGLNDSAAISLSNVGVVMNDSADISKQMSDVILLNNNLNSLLELENISINLQKLISKNIKETVVVNSSLIGLGLFNILSPSTLSILHNLTTLRIVLRSLKIK